MPCRWAAHLNRRRSVCIGRAVRSGGRTGHDAIAPRSGAGRRSPREKPPRGVSLGVLAGEEVLVGKAPGRGPIRFLPPTRHVVEFDAVRERGFTPAPQRGKDHSDAVVFPSRSFVLGSRRSKVLHACSPPRGICHFNRRRGWPPLHGQVTAPLGGVPMRKTLFLDPVANDGPAKRSRPTSFRSSIAAPPCP